MGVSVFPPGAHPALGSLTLQRLRPWRCTRNGPRYWTLAGYFRLWDRWRPFSRVSLVTGRKLG